MDFKPILYVIGLLLSVLSASMALPMMADLYAGNPDWKVFFLCMSLTAFFGGSLVLSNAGRKFHLGIRQAFVLTTLGWLTIALFGALPFKFSELDMHFVDAFFEAMSGVTTTGATVITDLDNAPPGILLWRAMLQWLGGIGIIVMALSVLPFLKVGGMQLFKMESSEKEKALPRAAQLSLAITFIYIGFSFVCAIAYMAVGLGTFDAIAHSMTTVATGGFSTRDSSIGAFQNAGAETVAITFMILSGMPFVLFLKTVRGNARPLFTDSQVRGFLSVLTFSILAMTAFLSFGKGIDFIPALRQSAFNLTSVMTGTGYATTNYSAWGSFAICYVLFLMVVGGCAGSTTCGIKIFRFQILYAVARSQIKKLLYPHAVMTPHYNKRPVPDDVVVSVMSFFFVFALGFVVAVITLSSIGLDFLTSISGAATALANVGPGLGEIIGPVGTFEPLPSSAKWVLSFCMLLGRLELFTVLVMFSPYFWKK